jgi:hypothetical protein
MRTPFLTAVLLGALMNVAAPLMSGASDFSAVKSGDTVVELMRNLCVRGHADAKTVLALADAQQWKPLSDSLKANFGSKPFTGPVDGRVLIRDKAARSVVVGDARLPTSQLTVRAHMCLVLQTSADQTHTRQDAAGWLQINPIVKDDTMTMWLFTTSADGRHTSVPKDNAAMVAAMKNGPVEIVVAGPMSSGGSLGYAVTYPDKN